MKGPTEVLAYVRAGDTLVVWKLDRLGRSLKDLITRIKVAVRWIFSGKKDGKPAYLSAVAIYHFEGDCIAED